MGTPRAKAGIKKAVTIKSGSGNEVVVTVVPPKNGGSKREDQELKAALKKHKPEFSANLTVARTFEELANRLQTCEKFEKIVLAVRGLEAKLGSLFSESIIKAMEDLPRIPPQVKTMFGLIRSSKMRNDIYYDDDEIKHTPILPLYYFVVNYICLKFPRAVGEAAAGLGDVLDGVTSVTLEGLPYDWEMVFDLENVNPGPILEWCPKKYHHRDPCRG